MKENNSCWANHRAALENFRGFSLAGIARSNPAGAWFLVCCSGRGLFEGPIPRPGESCRMCVRCPCEWADPLCRGVLSDVCERSLRRADPSYRGVMSDVYVRGLCEGPIPRPGSRVGCV